MHKLARLLAVAALTLLVAPPMATAQVLLREGILRRCLGVEGGVAKQGMPLVGYICDGRARNETFYPQRDGTIRAFSPTSNLCLDANDGAYGRQVLIWACHGGANQVWNYNNRLLGINNRCIDLLNARGKELAILSNCLFSVQMWQPVDPRAFLGPQPTPPPLQPPPPRTQQLAATTPAQPVPNNIAPAMGNTNPTNNPGLISTPGPGLTTSQPRPSDFTANTGAALIGNNGAALKEVSATHITQVTPLAELANVTPLRTFSTQAVGDPAMRVQQGFQTSLGRAPSSDEQSAWVSWINSHPQFQATRSWQGIVEMFRAALAHPAVGRNLRAAIIQQAFAALAGRAPSPQELATWDQRVQGNHYVYADLARELPSTGTPHARPAFRATAH